MRPDPDGFLAALARQPELAGARRFVVAFSGGLDSSVLLDIARRALPRVEGASLHAVHVDHGWHEQSSDWAAHCARNARRLGVRFAACRVEVQDAGASPEAAARKARYAALAAQLGAGDVLLTAHHADDQLETVLLQLARGAGPAGLAAMPVVTRFATGWHWRPLLATARSGIERYAAEAALDVLVDPANDDLRYDRSYVRSRVVPALRERWPGIATAAGRAARHCADAAALAEALADDDLASTADPHGRLDALQVSALAPARQRNVLRYWIAGLGLPTPSTAQLERARVDLLGARADAEPCVAYPGAQLRRYRGRLYAMQAHEPVPEGWEARLDDTGPLALPAGLGVVELEPTRGAGLARRHARSGLHVTFRAGGEALRPARDASTRTLRNLFQERAVVPWMRNRIPFLWIDGGLAAVGDLWVAHEFAAGRGAPGARVVWRDHPPLY